MTTDSWMPDQLDVGITDRCDRECRYCYNAKSGPAVGDMPPEVCQQVLEYTRRLAQYHEPLQGTHPIVWNLFGGEPFLAFPIVQHLATEAERQHLPVDITVFTNGASATVEQIAWCREHGIRSQRSVGGCPEACAITRPGDYLARYEAQTALWCDWDRQRRVTLTPDTARYLMRSLKYFYGRGYWGGLDFQTDDYADWPEETVTLLKGQLTRLALEFIRQFRAGHVLHNERLQTTGHRLFGEPRNYLGCGAGWGTQAITPDGYLMACHRFLREPRESPFCGGLLRDVLDGQPPRWGRLFTDHVAALARQEERDECRLCPARPVCSRGCYHVSWITARTLGTSPRVRCEITRHYVELARLVHVSVRDADPQWYACDAERCEAIPEAA